jgi:hypothetical protein
MDEAQRRDFGPHLGATRTPQRTSPRRLRFGQNRGESCFITRGHQRRAAGKEAEANDRAGEKSGRASDTMRSSTRSPKIQRKLPGSELLLQAQINRGNAQAGGSGPNVLASAMISVLVTLDGAPVDDLGATTGNGTGEISLPAGWGLWAGFNVRFGGSDIPVTEFGNQGDGIYDIRIVLRAQSGLRLAFRRVTFMPCR